jgi:hypothetical protein
MLIETPAQRLLKTRPGYAEEVRWHKFLLDSWTGGGGYSGRIVQPEAGFWGLAAEVYSRALSETRVSAGTADSLHSTSGSYLDRFPREEQAKYSARVAISHFGNLFRPLTALKLGFYRRVPPRRDDIPEKIKTWSLDVDGQGTKLPAMIRALEQRAAIFGWCPVLVDSNPLPEGTREVSRAQAREAGAGVPRLIPLLPANVLDWSVGVDGLLDWAKIRIDRIERLSWDSDPVMVSRITTWTRDAFEVWEVRSRAVESQGNDLVTIGAGYTSAGVGYEAEKVNEGPHGFGRVPLVGWRSGEPATKDDPLRAEAIHGDVALRNRRLFNLESELDEHLRGQVFAILQVPTKGSASELVLGGNNALAIDPASSQPYAYIAPPASVAETIETRIERTSQECYRSARIEWVRSSAAATSAVSRRSEFDATNAALVDLGVALCESEMELYRAVGPALGVSPEELADTKITPAEDYEVEALAEDLANIETALRIDAGPTFRGMVLKRFVQRFMGNTIESDTWGTIEEEIEESVARQQSMQEALAADPLGLGQPQEDPSDPYGKGKAKDEPKTEKAEKAKPSTKDAKA